jgi:hypothetical protein
MSSPPPSPPSSFPPEVPRGRPIEDVLPNRSPLSSSARAGGASLPIFLAAGARKASSALNVILNSCPTSLQFCRRTRPSRYPPHSPALRQRRLVHFLHVCPPHPPHLHLQTHPCTCIMAILTFPTSPHSPLAPPLSIRNSCFRSLNPSFSSPRARAEPLSQEFSDVRHRRQHPPPPPPPSPPPRLARLCFLSLSFRPLIFTPSHRSSSSGGGVLGTLKCAPCQPTPPPFLTAPSQVHPHKVLPPRQQHRNNICCLIVHNILVHPSPHSPPLHYPMPFCGQGCL